MDHNGLGKGSREAPPDAGQVAAALRGLSGSES